MNKRRRYKAKRRRAARSCCTGINGSHTLLCPLNTGPELVCWRCGKWFPSHWAASWSKNGSRHLDGNCQRVSPRGATG